jgi:hypothetical protein
LGLQSGVFLSGFPTKTLYAVLPLPVRATLPDHLIFLNNIWWGEQIIKLLIIE